MAKIGKIMIVIWKWKELLKNGLLSKTFFVEGCDKSKFVIAVNQDFPNKEVHTYLKELIQKLIENNEIYLFFHREKFDTEDLKEVLAFAKTMKIKEGQLKCFQISGGQDYIYYSTNNEGLLDNTGEFMNDPDETDVIEDMKGNLVEVPYPVKVYSGDIKKGDEIEIILFHFNNVWDYYEHEYAKKIGELQTNLVKILSDFDTQKNNFTAYSGSYWTARIKKEAPYLRLQIGSLLKEFNKDKIEELDNNYEINRAEEGKQKIEAKEITEEISLTFDDVNVNMEAANDNLKAAYSNLSKTLKFFHEKNSGENRKVSFNELNNRFNEVLDILYKAA